MDKKVAVVSALIEGCSVRSTSRMTGVAKGTILRLLADVGTACAQYQDTHVRNVAAQRIQVDEIWSFCYAKKKNVTLEMAESIPGAGDVWTFVAIEAQSKLVLSWFVGERTTECAEILLKDVSARVSNRVQLTTDGHRMYFTPVVESFCGAVDYGQLVKVYGKDPKDDSRYSPAECVSADRVTMWGAPEEKHISTSFVERQNLTMRMSMRRFTRLTNAFSKKLENHIHSVNLFYMHYNFVRIHQSLRVTPAMEAGITNRLWSIWDIVAMVEETRVAVNAA
jgi:IS1 family transposase